MIDPNGRKKRKVAIFISPQHGKSTCRRDHACKDPWNETKRKSLWRPIPTQVGVQIQPGLSALFLDSVGIQINYPGVILPAGVEITNELRNNTYSGNGETQRIFKSVLWIGGSSLTVTQLISVPTIQSKDRKQAPKRIATHCD
jgi:predicted oxidoreductase